MTIIVCVYVSLVVAYGVWSYNTEKNKLFKGLNSTLFYVASNIKRILPPDFHDRAVDKNSISKEENAKNSTILSDYVNKTGIVYAYTMVKKDGNIYFTSSSNMPEDIITGDITDYFLKYEEADESTKNSFDQSNVTFNTRTDRWGSFYSALVPERSPGGNVYIAGANMDAREVEKKLSSIFWRSLIISGIFIVLVIPFILAHAHSSKERIEEFENLRDMLHQKSMQRTTRIDKKIEEYIKGK